MLTTCPQENPAQPSPRSGPSGVRARVGFKPNTPEAEAGMRIEPPPSLAWATGRMRAATAAAAPPDEPPDECARFHGLRVGPNRRDSVVASIRIPEWSFSRRSLRRLSEIAGRGCRCDRERYRYRDWRPRWCACPRESPGPSKERAGL